MRYAHVFWLRKLLVSLLNNSGIHLNLLFTKKRLTALSHAKMRVIFFKLCAKFFFKNLFTIEYGLSYSTYQKKSRGVKIIGISPLGTGCKLNVHKTFRRRPGRLLNVLCTLSLHPVSRGSAKRRKHL